MFTMRIAGAALLAALIIPHAEAAIHWSPMPQKHGAMHQRNAAKVFMLSDGKGATVHLVTPHLDARPLALEKGHVSLSATGIDNYHALVAVQKDDQATDIAIRYVYMHGKPSGHSPSEITAFAKSRLEIVPDPLPREHWRYISGEAIHLIARFNEAPLANRELVLTTSNGSRLTATTSAEGRASFILPDDFARVKADRRGNRPGEMLVTLMHEDNGHRYTTTLSHDYHVNPSYWQSSRLGIGVVAAGMFAGIVLVYLARRKRG